MREKKMRRGNLQRERELRERKKNLVRGQSGYPPDIKPKFPTYS